MNKEALPSQEIQTTKAKHELAKEMDKETVDIEKELQQHNSLLEASRSKIKELAIDKAESTEHIKTITQPEVQEANPRLINKELQASSLSNELRHIRKKLNPVDKTASKIIHSPVIRALSNKSSSTIARPSGLLGGAIVAFTGSLMYLFFAKTIGIKYNYLMYIILFIGGFILGLIIELLFKIFLKQSSGRSST